MANFKLNKIKVTGISVCVPKNIVANRNNTIISKDDMEEFISTTGVEERRVSRTGVCTSDLGLAAAEKLIKELKWEKSEIDVLIFISQTADYKLPVTSAILQDRLGLSKECVAFDIPLGCSGYVYGLSAIGTFMQATKLKKGLMIAGDTSCYISKQDKSSEPLFGEAASATAIEYDENAPEMFFNLGTDGSGYKAIIIPDGGARNYSNKESLIMEEIEPGIKRNKCQLVLDGMDVFSFGITQAPKTVRTLIEHYAIDKDGIDYFVFHQANMMMNKMINKKLKLPDEKVPHSLKHFGNTSSASIPVTIVSELKEKIDKGGNLKFLLCGFGVGLSWGTVYLQTSDLVCCELIEHDEEVAIPVLN